MISDPVLIVYYVLAGVSITCSVFVVLTLWLYGSLRTSATRLLLALHITLVCEEITALPYVYNTNESLCEGVAFLHYYFGLASVVAIGFLVISYRYHFFPDLVGVSKFIHNWSLIWVLCFPMITFLPFITNSYKEQVGPWCAIGGERDDHSWTFGIFIVWVWFILFCSAIWLVITMMQVYKIDRTSGHRMFSTVGMYSIISVVTWIPRTSEQIINFTSGMLSPHEWEASYIPLFVAGILYTLVFLTEKKALILFDRAFHSDQRDFEERTNSSFSWEGSDFRFTNSSNAGSQGSLHALGSAMNNGRMASLSENPIATKSSTTRSPFVLSMSDSISLSKDNQDHLERDQDVL